MSLDLAFDGGSRAHPQPRLQNRGQLPPLPGAQDHDQFIALVRALSGDGRATPAGRPGHDPQAVRLPAKSQRAAVAERTQCVQLLSLAGLPVQVAPQPGLALDQERLGQPLGISLAPGGPAGHGDDRSTPRIDRNPQEPGPSRAPDRAFEAPARQSKRCAPLGRRRHATRVPPRTTSRSTARPRGRRRPGIAGHSGRTVQAQESHGATSPN